MLGESLASPPVNSLLKDLRTRQDTIEALALASMGKVIPQYTLGNLKDIEKIYAAMRKGELTGRVVLDLKQA